MEGAGKRYLLMQKGSAKNFKLKRQWPKERDEQAALVQWLRLKDIPHFAIPNGEKRDIITAVNLKRQGVSAGVPDICVCVPTSWHHGLFLELKRISGGHITEAQHGWVDRLNSLGYLALFVYGWEEARDKVEQYLDGRI